MVSKLTYQAAKLKCIEEFYYNKQKEEYYNKMIDQTKGTPYEFYNLMKKRNKSSNTIPFKLVTNSGDCIGNERYIQLAKSLSANFGTPSIDFAKDQAELDNQLQNIYNINYCRNNVTLWANFNARISTDEMKKQIESLNNRKNPGPMNIHPRLLKESGEMNALSLTNIINAIIDTAIIPKAWKKSILIPIPKPGNRERIENYRDIAIQSILPKILDKIITTKLYETLSIILDQNQHGFCKGKGTITNLAEYMHDILKSRNKNITIDAIYFDFSKAFDSIDHRIMAKELAKLSCPYIFFKLIMNFILNRKYTLNVDGNDTGIYFAPRTGVPQGSHCGPLLFILYINSLKNILNINYKLYADDIKIYNDINNRNDKKTLQQNTNAITRWAETLKLSLNLNKTYHIRFGSNNIAATYYLGMIPIKKMETVRDLGLHIDDKLTLKNHINNTYLKMTRMLGTARRLVYAYGYGQYTFHQNLKDY